MNSESRIPTAALQAELEAVSSQREQLAARDGQLARKQAWLEQGIRYATGDDSGGFGGSADEIVPPEAVFADRGATPTIRQSIVLVMKDSSVDRIWRPAQVIEELAQRGWLPRAKTAPQMVRNRMLAMLDRGELVKRGPGGYQLAAHVRNTGLLQVDSTT